MVSAVVPRYEYRIFGNNLDKYIQKIKELSELEKTRHMDSVYLITPWRRKNNVKIRGEVMDIKTLEQEYKGLEQWNPLMVGEFPLEADVIKSVVFPALGVESPVFERKKYTLKQFLKEVVSIDPDLAVAFVKKTRHAYTIAECITEIAEIKVNGAGIKTICIEAEDPEKVLSAKKLLGLENNTENVSYPLALKRIMGLAKLPDYWESDDF